MVRVSRRVERELDSDCRRRLVRDTAPSNARQTAPVTRRGRPSRDGQTSTTRKIPFADSARPTQESVSKPHAFNYRRDSGQLVRGSATSEHSPPGDPSAPSSTRTASTASQRVATFHCGEENRSGRTNRARTAAVAHAKPTSHPRAQRRPRDQRKQTDPGPSDTKLSPRRRVHRVSFVYPRTVSRTR